MCDKPSCTGIILKCSWNFLKYCLSFNLRMMRMEMTWLHHIALSSSTGDAHIFRETARDEACVWLSQKRSGRQTAVLHSSDPQRHSSMCEIPAMARAASSAVCVCAALTHSTCTYMMEKPAKHTHRALANH